MNVFIMFMLRCVLIMHLSSFLQNGTLATLEELAALQKWENSCLKMLINVTSAVRGELLDDPSNIPQIKQKLNAMLNKVKAFPLKKETEELLKRRLQKPLEIAISNCDKVLDKVTNSGLKKNKKYLENLSSKIRSLEAGYVKEMNTFLFEVGLELIKNVEWKSDNKIVLELKKKFKYLLELLRYDDESYCDNNLRGWLLEQVEKKNPPENQKEFFADIKNFIVNTKLNILNNELSDKIALFEEHQPHIDGDGFIEFSRNFKLEWDKIEQKIVETKIGDIKMEFTQEFADIKTYRERLDDLAKNALNETASLKGIITKKLDELVTKCDNDGLNAMMDVISDIGMFDGAAFNVLVDNAGFSCAKFEEAVKQDQEMVSTAYQVKDNYTDDEMMDETDG